MAIEEDESDFGGNRGDNDATTDQEPVSNIHRHLRKRTLKLCFHWQKLTR
jgi:hypothetical protein